MKTLQLRPFVTAAEVFKLGPSVTETPEGVSVVAVQTIVHDDGTWELRIGDTILKFMADGTYDGGEMFVRATESALIDALPALLELSAQSEGKRPERPYYRRGTVGHTAEMRTLAELGVRGPELDS